MSLIPPLYKAVFDGDCQKIRALLVGRDVNIGNDGKRCYLLHAALDGLNKAPKPDVIDLLIEFGADVNAQDRDGWTPLHFAARTKCPNGDSPMLIRSIKLLIAAGADINAEDKEGFTPLHRSICRYPWNFEMIEVLLAAGAKATEIFRRVVNAVASPEKDRIVQLLAKYGVSVKED